MADAIVGPLLSKLQEVVVAEATTLAGVGDSIDSLRDKLMWLHALLQEIEQRRHDTSRFRQVLAWQIREVASQAEDAIDKFLLRADLSRRGWPRAVVFVFNLCTLIRARWTIYPQVQSMNARLEEIIDNSGKYGTVYDGPAAGSSDEDKSCWKQSAMRREWLWENSAPFEMMGRTKEKEQLKKKLSPDQSSPLVIYVVGDAGMGKRTLLRSAYEDIEIKSKFDVCFSVRFQPSIREANIVEQIKKQLDTNGSPSGNTRFLVWINSPNSITKWGNDQLKSLKDNRLVKFMVSATSRHEWMGRDSSSFIELKPLENSESLELFDYTVDIWKRRTSDNIKNGIEKVRENIKDFTNGLPLAVVTLAKFMIAMDNYNRWELSSNYQMSNINDDKLKVMLHLSIDDLPDEVKLCLLYTAGFPENTIIDAKQLLRLWTAEGFLSPQHGMEAEQLGQCYLKELIHRGLLLNKTSPDSDEILFVAIHDRFHPIFRSEGQRRSFMHVHCGGLVVAAPDNTRRLALQNYQNKSLHLGDCYGKLRTVVSFCHEDMDHPSLKTDGKDSVEDTTKSPGTDSRPEMERCWASCHVTCSASCRATCSASTRSCWAGIAWNPGKVDSGMRRLLRGSPYLRVINLEGLDIGTDVPDEIGDMVHLRYLGLRCPSLKLIPSSIGKLGRLQTLDVRGTDVKKLPRSFWKIRTLLHVLGDGLIFPSKNGKERMVDFFSCSKKKKEKPADLADSLRTLETVTIQDVDHRWKRRISLLHRLHVVGLQGSDKQCPKKEQRSDEQPNELENILGTLRCLQSLSLSGDAIPVDYWFANQPDKASRKARNFSLLAEHLISLELEGKLWLCGEPIHQKTSNLSGYNICLLKLTRLVLRSTRIEQNFINVIAELPVLTELALLENSYEGETVVFCAQGFVSLKALRLSGLFNLKEIFGPEGWTIRPFIDMPHAEYKTHQPCGFCPRPAADKTIVQGTNKSVLHEMIMEAIDEGHSSKTAIGDYITKNYGDPLVKILEHMVECHEIKSERQRNYNIYHLVEPHSGAREQSQTMPCHKEIREVIDKNGSSKTAISINFKKKHRDIPLAFVLKHMLKSGHLKSDQKNHTIYSKSVNNGGQDGSEKKGQHGTEKKCPNETDKKDQDGSEKKDEPRPNKEDQSELGKKDQDGLDMESQDGSNKKDQNELDKNDKDGLDNEEDRVDDAVVPGSTVEPRRSHRKKQANKMYPESDWQT